MHVMLKQRQCLKPIAGDKEHTNLIQRGGRQQNLPRSLRAALLA